MTAPARPSASTVTDDQLDDLYARLDAVRALHQPMQRGGLTVCRECSGWDGRRCLGALTDFPCATVRALAPDAPATRATLASPGPAHPQTTNGSSGTPKGAQAGAQSREPESASETHSHATHDTNPTNTTETDER